MKRITIKIFLAVLCAVTMFSSCFIEAEENLSMTTEVTNDVLPLMTRSGSDVLYEKLPNPYTLRLMQKIYDDYSIEQVALEPTDLYVCFMPQDSAQFRTLYDNGELELFDYPLDVVLEEGEEYINPELGDDELSWLYTTVKPDFEFPEGIRYEIIDTCYIPADGETITQTKSMAVDVEAVALGRMGFDVDTILTKEPGVRMNPSGSICVYKDSSSIVPVKGVKVRCNNVVKWAVDYTDENGNYTMEKSFKTRVHYAVVFENEKNFDLWGNKWPIGRANHNMGWNDNAGHSVVISRQSNAWEWAAVNNAAYDYYIMCENTGISLPPPNLKMWVIKGASVSSAPMLRRINHSIGLNTHSDFLNFFANYGYGALLTFLNQALKIALPDITIGTDSMNYYDIYKTVNHELAHASHFSNVGSSFWAKYISYILTYGPYGDGTGKNAELCAISEMWGYFMGLIQKEEFCQEHLLVGGYSGDTGESWIKPQVFYDLYVANVLTKKQIYQILTSSIDTYEELIDKMIDSYLNKSNLIKLAFARYGVIVDDIDVYGCPPADSVKLNQYFEIAWAYTTDKSLHDIDYRLLKEKYFDGNISSNIVIAKDLDNKCSAYIMIEEPGYYIIEANPVGTSVKRYFHIAKHYRPEFTLPYSECFVGAEPVEKLGTRFGDPYTISVTFGSDNILSDRIVALSMVNYRQLTTASRTSSRRADLRYVYAGTDTLKVNAGVSSTVELPELYNYIYEEIFYDPDDTNLETHPEYIKYTTQSQGYYTITYPNDKCMWSYSEN